MNTFEALCKLASDENWCWNLSCTTCRQMHFRYAFSELAAGKSPLNRNWIIHNRGTNYSTRLGEFPMRYTDEQKTIIHRICSEVRIIEISKTCKFPDWLGYMGLVLELMYSQSISYKELCHDWAKQLLSLVPGNSDAYSRLQKKIAMESNFLSIHDLEMCEYSMRNKSVNRS